MKNVDCACGKNACGQRKMGINCRRVGDQSVKRDKRPNCRKDGQQRIKDDPSRDGEQPVVIHARIYAPKDIFPPCPRNFPRSRCAPSPPLLLCSTQLRQNRLIVLELLPWPLVRHRWRRLARDFATLVRPGIDDPVRFADRVVAPAFARSRGFFTARRGNRN